MEDLDDITAKMLTKPILFSTRVEISRRDYYDGYIIRGKILHDSSLCWPSDGKEVKDVLGRPGAFVRDGSAR